MSLIVDDRRPADVLEALDGPGPVVVVDHRRVPPDDLARRLDHAPPGTWLVALTSGSTAEPRAVCRTRDSWQVSVAALAEVTGVGPGMRVLVPGPLASTLFLHAAWHARQAGAEPVIAPLTTRQHWDVAHLVPRQLSGLLSGDVDLSGRTVVAGGAALPAALASRAAERGLAVVTYYGAAELSFVAVRAPDSTSEGMAAFPGVEVSCREGLVWARGPLLATGYLPDASGHRATAGALRHDIDGWASVGDRGRMLADGSVVITSRGEDAVQSGGATIDVAEVEAVLSQAPDVTDVVVLAVPHSDLGHVVGAVVERAGPADPQSVRTMRGWARDRLAPEALPRRWHLTPALPRTAGGKVDRIAARALLAPADAPD